MRYSLFPIVMKMHSVLGLPAMTSLERKMLKKLLLSLGEGHKLNIFEYGSGFSTIYYSQFLKKEKASAHLYSVDNNSAWHQKVKKLVNTKGLGGVVTLYLSEFPPFWEKDGWDWKIAPKCEQFAPKTQAEFEYINTPLTIGEKFDFVIVDGRFRRRCLEVVPQCLSENGIVFLHDAYKVHYHQPLQQYKYSRSIKSGRFYPLDEVDWHIWLGSINNPIILEI